MIDIVPIVAALLALVLGAIVGILGGVAFPT
jgi:hypothetical protein